MSLANSKFCILPMVAYICDLLRQKGPLTIKVQFQVCVSEIQLTLF